MAGWACAVGLDGWRLIETDDPAERLALVAVTLEARKARGAMGPDIWGGGA